MATRAMIGVQLPEGKVRAVYNHFDGYPEYLGMVLYTQYQDLDVVESLCSYPIRTIKPDGVPEYLDNEDTYETYDSPADYYTEAEAMYGVEYLYLLSEAGWEVYSVDNESLDSLESLVEEIMDNEKTRDWFAKVGLDF